MSLMKRIHLEQIIDPGMAGKDEERTAMRRICRDEHGGIMFRTTPIPEPEPENTNEDDCPF